MAKQTPYGWLCLFGCYDKHHRKQSAFQGQAIPFPLGYEEAFFSGKVSDFLASFPEKKIGFCLDLCEGKRVLRIGWKGFASC